MNALLTVQDIHKQYRDTIGVLRGIDLEIQHQEIACLLGPSGCGKTTLLRIISGLERPDMGKILFDQRDMLSVPVHQRGFGLMFQDYALFPHLDVTANVAFGLRMKRLSTPEIQKRVRAMLQLVDLESLAHRNVTDLSGGEQQRVALARSLAPQPKLLMLDEPIGALDRTLRDRLITRLRHILKRVGVTVLYVTHDQSEAFAIADRVFLMNNGQIVQKGTPEEVYRRPGSAWVARFLGMHNVLAGEWIGPGMIQTSIGRLRVEGKGSGPVVAVVRPDAASVGPADQGTPIVGEVLERSFLGAIVQVIVRYPSGDKLTFALPPTTHSLVQGESVVLYIQADGVVCLDGNDTNSSLEIG